MLAPHFLLVHVGGTSEIHSNRFRSVIRTRHPDRADQLRSPNLVQARQQSRCPPHILLILWENLHEDPLLVFHAFELKKAIGCEHHKCPGHQILHGHSGSGSHLAKVERVANH